MENVGIFCVWPFVGNILQKVGTFYVNFGYLPVIWYIFPRFGILYQEKSGNPADHKLKLEGVRGRVKIIGVDRSRR
jgi:hypothetical protein